ncbi:2-dehydropantoate 2-reductase [Alkalihalobacterium elongatum]|uniref:2-dehydropantoate 2-reductase n=1 Tax=Alkalihalobacterium elongatum TaxID=2675466 RepID=UPI001C1F6B40|nr:2-dehydropantoate 2-reductase [Alkalihalobacterium elongatum]
MRLGVIGGGAIGLLTAAYLRKFGNEVTVFTRSPLQAKQLRERGVTLHRNNKLEVFSVHAQAIDEVVELNADILFVTVKQFHIEDLFQTLQQKSFIPQAMVFMQNGMSHLNFIKELPIHSLFIGIVEHGAMRLSGTEVEHTGVGIIKIGAVKGGSNNWDDLWKSISHKEFQVVVLSDWLKIMNRKLVVNSCINPLTALYRVKNGVLVSNTHFLKLMRAVFDETVLSLELDDIEEMWNEVLLVCKKTANNRSSMLRDIEKRNETEIDAILGYVLSIGEQKHLKLPITKFLFESIKGIEQEEREKVE